MAERDVEALARLLLSEGYLDNEVDARRAAITIILAHEALTAEASEGSSVAGVGFEPT